MAEQSFPAIEKPLTDDQWKSVTLGIGDGILDEGGDPYGSSLSDQTDQVTIGVDSGKGYAHAILKGFYHKIDAPVSLSLPAVSVETTYRVCLQYDPTRTDLPVKLGVFKGTLDRSSGKEYLELWTIVRKPNQLLTDASRTAVAPHVTPILQFSRSANFPDPGNVLFGTLAHARYENVTYRAEGGFWKPITGFIKSVSSMGGWSPALSGNGFNAVPTTGGFMCQMTGFVLRTAETYTISGWSVLGTMIPSAWRPPQGSYCTGYIPGSGSCAVRLNSDGQLEVAPVNGGSLSLKNGWPVHFQLVWYTSTTPSAAI